MTKAKKVKKRKEEKRKKYTETRRRSKKNGCKKVHRQRRIKCKGIRWPKEQINKIPNCPGVYVLIYRNKPCYIGKSRNIRRRVREHMTRGMNFTRVTWYGTTPKYRHELEKKLIKKYRQKVINKRIG